MEYDALISNRSSVVELVGPDGMEVVVENCPKCNFVLTPGATECPACGVILSKLRAPAPRPVAQAVPPPQPYPQPQGQWAPPASPAPVPVMAPNPYAPPVADIAPPPLPPPVAASPGQPLISPPTLAALQELQPRIRFVALCGMAGNGLMILTAVGLMLYGMVKPQLFPLSLAYLFYGGIGFLIVLPLQRCSEAASRLSALGATASLETFIKEQAVFWRRLSLMIGISLALTLAGVFLAVMLGGLAATLK